MSTVFLLKIDQKGKYINDVKKRERFDKKADPFSHSFAKRKN